MTRSNGTRNALLGFLSWGPMSGYDVRRLIEGSVSNFWSEGYGRIYPMLAQLAEQGLATREETPSDGGRARHVYQLTERGRAALADWLREPTLPRPPRNERLLKLFFGARTEPALCVGQVEAYRDELLDTRQHYLEIRERLEAAKDAPKDQRFWLMTLRYGDLEVDAQLRWCAEVLEELRAMADDTPQGDRS